MTGAAASAVWIAAGGAAGSVARYLLSVGVQRAAAAASSPRGHGLFPFGTLTVNVLGSLAIGFLSVRLLQGAAIAPHHRLGILVGVLGGFTTFSTFSYETV